MHQKIDAFSENEKNVAAQGLFGFLEICFAAKSAVRLRKAGFLILEKYYEFGLSSCLGDKSGKLKIS